MTKTHSERRRRQVVAAAIVDNLARPARLLCASRAYPDRIRGKFELPGGKIEIGETPQVALHREIQEELSTQIILGQEVPGPAGPWPIMEGRSMCVWLAKVQDGAPNPTVGSSHLQIFWYPIENLNRLPWLETNVPIIHAIQERAAFRPEHVRPATKIETVQNRVF